MALTLTIIVESDITLSEGVGGTNLHALDYLSTLVVLKLDGRRSESSIKLLQLLGLSKLIRPVERIAVVRKRVVHDVEGTLLHAKPHRIPGVVLRGLEVSTFHR